MASPGRPRRFWMTRLEYSRQQLGPAGGWHAGTRYIHKNIASVAQLSLREKRAMPRFHEGMYSARLDREALQSPRSGRQRVPLCDKLVVPTIAPRGSSGIHRLKKEREES